MRICILSHSYPRQDMSGRGHFVHSLARHFVKLGHETHAIIPAYPGAKKEDVHDGVYIHRYHSKTKIDYGGATNEYFRTPKAAVAVSMLSSLRLLIKVVRKYKIDLIHAHWALPSGFIAILSKLIVNKPVVITTHGRDVYVNPEMGYIVPTLWYVKPFLRCTLQYADQIIVISRDCWNHARRAGAPESKTALIYNGTDNDRFRPDKKLGAKVRKQCDIGEDEKLLLSVRYLEKRKGLHILLDAMPKVLLKFPKCRLFIIGDGPFKDHLERQIKDLEMEKYVTLLGSRSNSELPGFYNACDLFVIPSLEESFGIAALEAMACQKPVVGTDAGGLVEVIENDRTGLVVAKGDPNKLADAIIKLLSDKKLADRLSYNAKQKIDTDFNWLNVAKKTVKLYEEII